MVLTSPPYINVFNYHQNNRRAMEIMGWDILHVARSEIGSNRKNRQNRFLTVVQYAIDMLYALHEARRVLRPDGRMIVVVGRVSNVRGVSFKNARLVAALATGGAGFSLRGRYERQFKNKFGELIYEDILHLIPEHGRPIGPESFARVVAEAVLIEAAASAEQSVRHEILDAIKRASSVQASPLFKVPDGTIVTNGQDTRRNSLP